MKLTYANKVALNENAEISDINKVTDSDMNEIKAVVNNNDDELITTNTNLTNATTYSTDEIRVGTWMNKPLYRKVYILTAIVGNNSYTLNPAPSNVDLMWFDLSATFLLQGSTGYARQGIDPSSVDPAYDFSARVVSKVSVNIYVGNIIANNSTIYATLLYTKTTD